MKCQILFSGNIRKNITNLSFAELVVCEDKFIARGIFETSV